MARLEDLVAQVGDLELRKNLETALAEMKRRQRFGLVFEEHIPETSALLGLPVRAGSLAQRRDDPQGKTLYRVVEVSPQDEATVEPVDGGEAETVSVGGLIAVKRFGEPIYPALTPLGSVRRGGEDKPHHAVINGENFHALQLLVYQYEGQVDCIYIDPPYNTGARDWKYNNRYVDDSDAWRHSKWLSMMAKRLRLAKRLLKPDGVLIVTIDEHEVHHLGMLLEKLYPEYQQTLITIVNNPKGTGATNFSRVGEYAIFLCPPGLEVIRKMPFGFGMPMQVAPRDHRVVEIPGDESGSLVRKLALRRDGAESSNRADRPRQFYAIYVDPETEIVTGIGQELVVMDKFSTERQDGKVPVYPIDGQYRHRVWRYGRDTMTRLIDQGEIRVNGRNRRTGAYSLYHFKPVEREDAESRRPRTVWWHSSHDAGAHGASLLNDLLGQRSLFPFPKSLYAVADCLRLVTEARPNALIVDVFAGSGTTFHATCLLNSEDGGNRRCVLVTNNEVDERAAKALDKKGIYRGDSDFEERGIFELVTRPRCEAAVTGKRPNGTPVPGKHLNGQPFEEGFPENVEFYRLDYLDPDEVDLGLQFEAILPVLWMAAGGVGDREKPEEGQAFSMPEGSTHGVLFRESRFRRFAEALEERPDVTHVWLITDSEEAFAEMRSALPARLSVSMLYRDYLRNFRINTERNL